MHPPCMGTHLTHKRIDRVFKTKPPGILTPVVERVVAVHSVCLSTDLTSKRPDRMSKANVLGVDSGLIDLDPLSYSRFGLNDQAKSGNCYPASSLLSGQRPKLTFWSKQDRVDSQHHSNLNLLLSNIRAWAKLADYGLENPRLGNQKADR
jgi:hypothetical protein